MAAGRVSISPPRHTQIHVALKKEEEEKEKEEGKSRGRVGNWTRGEVCSHTGPSG